MQAADAGISYEAPQYEAPVHEAPVHEAPVHEAPVHEPPAFEPPVLEQAVFEAPVLAAPPAAQAPAPVSTVSDPAAAASQSASINPSAQSALSPAAEPAQTQAAIETTQAQTSQPAPVNAPINAPVSEPLNVSGNDSGGRDYERRALPIENEEAVLGTNWRDAVIAKAVGSAMPSEDGEANQSESAKPAPQLNAAPTDGPLRILLAEDNAINALLTRTLLEAEGCDVDVVEDGQLAVEAMKSRCYDMIFMDMRMPNMDGLESTRKIRALPNVPKSLPIVALTANAFDDDRNACFDSGMNDFMTKPVSAEELADMVQQWARKQRDAAAA
jgi:CheY-like chemotaxis protein